MCCLDLAICSYEETTIKRRIAHIVLVMLLNRSHYVLSNEFDCIHHAPIWIGLNLSKPKIPKLCCYLENVLLQECIVLHAVSCSLVWLALKLSCFLVFYEKNSNKNNNVNKNKNKMIKRRNKHKKMCTIVKIRQIVWFIHLASRAILWISIKIARTMTVNKTKPSEMHTFKRISYDSWMEKDADPNYGLVEPNPSEVIF